MTHLVSTSGPLDLERIDDATGGDLEFLSELVEIFLEDADLRLEELEQACGSADPVEVRKTAHKLKGSSANIGAVGLMSIAKRLEEMGLASDLAGANDHLDTLRSEYARVKVALQQLVAEAA